MNLIESILYRYEILQLSERKLHIWYKGNQVEKIIYAAQNGVYNIRLLSVRMLASHIQNGLARNQLIKMIDDEVDLIANAAISIFNETKDQAIISRIKVAKNRMRKNRNLLNEAQIKRYANPAGQEFYNPKEKLINQLKADQKSFHPPFGF